MGITEIYSPAAGLVGSAAYDTGLAEALRQRQAEQLAAQQHAQSIREQQREFDITNQRQYDQIGEQQYQFDVGTAQHGQQFAQGQKQFAEGQRQFDATLGLKQQDFAEQQKNDAFNRQMAEHRDKLARYGMLQQGAAQAANQQGQLAEADLRGQYGLAEAQMHEQALVQREAMQGGQQWQQQAAKQMQADWSNVQKALPKLDPSEREDLINQFYQHWQNANVPMPVEIPQQKLPEWQDPDAQWSKAQAQQAKDAEQGFYYHLVPDSKNGGMPSIMRGSPAFPQTPEGLKQQHEYQMQIEGLKSQEKQAAAHVKMTEAEVKKQEAFDMSQLKAMDAEMKAAQAEDNHRQSQRHAEDLHFSTMQKNLADLQLKIANAKSKPPNVDANGKEAPSVDTTEMEKTVADYKSQIEQFKAGRQALAASDPFADTPSQTASNSPPQPSTQRPAWETLPDSRYAGVSDGSLAWDPASKLVQMGVREPSGAIVTYVVHPVKSREDIAKLGKGEKFILPDGRTGTRQ